MKLSMEIIYFPESTFTQKKEMMADWTLTSNRASNFSYICMATSLVMFFFLLGFKDDFFFVYGGCAAIFLLGGILCRKWSYLGYVCVFIGLLLSCLRFYVDTIEGLHIMASVVMQAVLSLVPSYFAFRCLYNFNYVFKELQKCKGFPNFIANTADLYGEKIYLRDEEETIYESRKKSSYNPFNTKEDIRFEEVRRDMDAEVKAEAEPIRMDIGFDGKLKPATENKKTEPSYKYGKTIFGREIIFLHNDVSEMSFEEKKRLMDKWRDNIEFATKEFPSFALLIMVAVMASGFGSFMGILNHAVVLVFILGTNQMKMGKWYAPIPLFLGTAYVCTMINSPIAMLCVIGAFVFNIGMVLGTIRYVLNYRLYKELSHQPGFPSFIRTTADLYGDKLYIVEPRTPVKKKDPTQRPVKVMDIGYDEKPKADEGAWNAFNYMDKKEDENDENN